MKKHDIAAQVKRLGADSLLPPSNAQKVGVFFFRPTLGGGSTTFTAQLVLALRAAGADPVIFRVVEKGSYGKRRQFGKYDGVEYEKIDPGTARTMVRNMPTVMGSPANSKYMPFEPDIITNLMKLGMRAVIHDPNEFTEYNHLTKGAKLPTRPICIRPTMQRFYKDALWIPHPYSRVAPEKFADVKRTKVALSIARVASVKRPKMLLDANRLLPKKLRIELRGSEYRMYTYQLAQKYSDVFQQAKQQSLHFPMTFEASVRIAHEAALNFDMTWFPDDGGGTQYAQMEAMDAGTVNVMHSDWWRLGKGEMVPGKHVLTVSSVVDIIKMVRNCPKPDMITDLHAEITHNGYELLKRHSPKRIGKMYLDEMNK